MRASFLPGPGASVRDKLDLLSMHRIDLTGGAVLEKDCVYIVPLLEYLALKKAHLGRSPTRRARSGGSTCSPASSPITAPSSTASARATRARSMPRSPARLQHPGAHRLAPRAVAHPPRLAGFQRHRAAPPARRGRARRSADRIGSAGPETIRNGLAFTVDVSGDKRTGIVGYKARRHTDVIDVDRIGHYDPRDFWEPVYPLRRQGAARDRARSQRFLHPGVARGGRRAARPCRRDGALRRLRRRVPGAFRRVFRPRLRRRRGRRHRQPRRPRSALARGAVPDRGRPDRRPRSSTSG